MKTKLFLALFLATISSCSNKKEIRIVSNGKTDYKIVIPENPSKEEIRAAEFLNYHLDKISGCQIPVIKSDNPSEGKFISISKSDEIEGEDCFKITTSGQNIIIKGGSDRGCIYAISEILEKYLGVRYFSPDYVLIPKAKEIILPEINITGTTPNTYRNVHGSFSENENYKDFHRLNQHEDMFAENYYVHTFHKLIPWQEYYEEHPEYFAQMNGKRIIDQLCLSNPEVLKLTIEKLGKEMLLQPDKMVWSVSQDDNFSYCQCDKCKKIIEEEGSAAGPIIRFVNDVAKEFPDKIISTLAYQYSRTAPKVTKPLSNVQVMLCTIELNRSQPIAIDPSSESFLKDIEDWGKICNHIYLWDYTVDFAHSYCPFPNLQTLQPNIQLFVKNNVKEHFQQTNTATGHEFSELKSYILAKLLWNPDSDVEAIILEFTDGYYGAAGEWIRKYIYGMQDEVVKTGEWLDIYGPATNYQKTFLSAENIKNYNSYFDKAEEAVKNDSAALIHVRTARMQLWYAIMEIGKADMFGPRGWYTEKNGEFIPKPEMTKMLEDFYTTANQAGCKYVNESGLTVEEYYQSSKRFINVQVKGNLAFRKKITASPLPSEKYSSGDLSVLTNGVRGANDYKVHWLGWEAQDFELVLDLEKVYEAETIEISTLYDPKSWILHPASVSCYVSENGTNYKLIEKQIVSGDQRKETETVNRTFSFKTSGNKFRYVKFEVKGTLKLFDWHPSAGGGSWVFVDEVVVK
ncbi:MAG: DUF4838 domain-containing protein [Weeksellaceae bacterium]|nr:DUF4838 domain-containing protein [Weeksellaceae bacterium]